MFRLCSHRRIPRPSQQLLVSTHAEPHHPSAPPPGSPAQRRSVQFYLPLAVTFTNCSIQVKQFSKWTLPELQKLFSIHVTSFRIYHCTQVLIIFNKFSLVFGSEDLHKGNLIFLSHCNQESLKFCFFPSFRLKLFMALLWNSNQDEHYQTPAVLVTTEKKHWAKPSCNISSDVWLQMSLLVRVNTEILSVIRYINHIQFI